MSGLSRRELLVAGAAAGLAGALAPGAFGATSSWLTRSGHAGLVGTTYDAEGAALRLVAVTGDRDDAFRLELVGAPGLAARIHELTHPSLGRYALFLGPVGPARAEQAYEVVVDRTVGALAATDAAPAPLSGGAVDEAPAGAGAPAASAGAAAPPASGPARPADGAGRRTPKRAPLVRSATAARRAGTLAADVRVAPGRGLSGVRVRLLHGDVVVARGARRLRGRSAIRLPLARLRAVPRGELWLEVTVTGRDGDVRARSRRRVSIR